MTAAITHVRIAIQVGDSAATDRPAYARIDQRVLLHAVLEAGGTIYSNARELSIGGKKVTPEPLAKAPRTELVWNRVEPAKATMSNGDGPTFHFEPIEYRVTRIDPPPRQGSAMDVGGGSIAADVRPTLTPDHGNGVGTMRYQLVARQGEREIATAGPDARRGRGSGGLTDTVARVTIRKDDTYLGYLTEMYNQPYIWASAGLSDKTHQSERLEGSDCADFVVYGARRMGATIPYMWTGSLPTVTKLLGGGTRDDHGVYRDARGVPVSFTVAGDLVLFPRHVGVLVEDRGTIGVVDDQDLIMHTLFDSPKIVPIADSGYAAKPLEVRRFK